MNIIFTDLSRQYADYYQILTDTDGEIYKLDGEKSRLDGEFSKSDSEKLKLDGEKLVQMVKI